MEIVLILSQELKYHKCKGIKIMLLMNLLWKHSYLDQNLLEEEMNTGHDGS